MVFNYFSYNFILKNNYIDFKNYLFRFMLITFNYKVKIYLFKLNFSFFLEYIYINYYYVNNFLY